MSLSENLEVMQETDSENDRSCHSTLGPWSARDPSSVAELMPPLTLGSPEDRVGGDAAPLQPVNKCGETLNKH